MAGLDSGMGGSDGAAVAACGAAGQVCCGPNACDDAACCVDGHCIGSGAACPDSLGTCNAGSCGTCGGAGQPCCKEATGVIDCTATGTVCQTTNGGQTYTCNACGQDGQQCCLGPECLGERACIFTDAGSTVCSSACGDPGQPCCSIPGVCKNGGCCLNEGSRGTCAASPTCGCTQGACTTCGVLGVSCCDGMVCAEGNGQCMLTADGGTVCGNRGGP